MRSSWLEFVRRVRARENRGKKSCTYKEAMKMASVTWPKEKKKIERRLKREKKGCPENGKPRTAPTKPLAETTGSRSAENGKVSNS